MGCDMNQERLSAFLDGELSHEDASGVAHHIDNCESCRSRAYGFTALGKDVKSALEQQMAPAKLESNIMAQIRVLRQRAQALRVSLVCGICTCGGFLMAVALLMSPFGVLVRPLFHLLMAASRESLHLTPFVNSLWAWIVGLCATFLVGCSLFGIRRLVRPQRNEVAV